MVYGSEVDGSEASIEMRFVPRNEGLRAAFD